MFIFNIERYMLSIRQNLSSVTLRFGVPSREARVTIFKDSAGVRTPRLPVPGRTAELVAMVLLENIGIGCEVDSPVSNMH